MEMKKKHIDDVQTQTVDEHFKLILEDNSVIDPEATDVTTNDLPDWYNKELYKKAQNYYKRNMLSLISGSLIGLIIVFSVTTILKVLNCTKRSNSTCLAFKRYVETVLHMHAIYTCDSNDANSNWYKSINMIRWNHKMGSKKSKSAGIGEISQRDMVLTQYAFIGFVYLTPRVFGLCNTLEEDDAFNHFWRVNGYMLGISDRFNLCRKHVKETIELCQKIKNLYRTYLHKAPPEFYEIMSKTINAFWYIDITVDEDSYMALTYKLYDLPFYKELGWYSWLIMKYREWLLYLHLVPYVGAVMRIYSYCLVMFILWSSQNFPVLAWIKFRRDNVRINLYLKH